MSGNNVDSGLGDSSSIYEKFKMNTHKMFNEDAFKDRSDLSSKSSKKSTMKSRGRENRNASQIPIKIKGALSHDHEHDLGARGGSLGSGLVDVSSNHPKKLKIRSDKKVAGSPIKLNKGLKSIENRILQKMKNKRDGRLPLTKMPSIERNNSPTVSYGNDFDSSKLTLGRVYDYNSKSTSKKHKHKNSDVDVYPSAKTDSIRQTLNSAFQPNDADSFINKIKYVKPDRDSQSEYDLYNSYGSSNGFKSDEKQMSDKMKFKIKASFRYRDEVETAETDSFFSSKFSKFSLNNNTHQGQGISKPNKSIMEEMIKRKQAGQSESHNNFPSIKKNMPNKSSPFSLPSLN
jgi:hypothetical protein